jgi:hypothetical protein
VPYLCRTQFSMGAMRALLSRWCSSSFNHHPEMSGLPAAEAGALLDWCEETIQETERRARRGAEG